MFVAHVTDATPKLSFAVPVNTIDAAEVETAVEDGDVIARVGGVVSLPLGADGVTGVAGVDEVCRVTT